MSTYDAETLHTEWAIQKQDGGIYPLPEGEEYARRYFADGPKGRTLLKRTVTDWLAVPAQEDK